MARSLYRGALPDGNGYDGLPLPKVEWQFANCSGLSLAVIVEEDDPFFPAHNENVGTFAKRLCSRCVIKVECGDYAILDLSIQHGIWGGLTHIQRIRERARRRLHGVGRVYGGGTGGDVPDVPEGTDAEMPSGEGRIGSDLPSACAASQAGTAAA